MGLGDEILAAGAARRIFEKTGQHTCITRADGRSRWSEVWENIEYIRRAPGKNIVNLVNCPGFREYILSKTETKWTWREYKPYPAQIVLSDAEKRFAEPYRGMLLLEPNIKQRDGNNKQWPWNNWVRLTQELALETIQVGPEGTRRLPYTILDKTKTFRLAMAVLSVCKACIVHEGALHHAAAALGVPAIVIRGGFISQNVTGYDGQVDLFRGAHPGCGMRIPCTHCKACMDAITVNDVLEAYERLI